MDKRLKWINFTLTFEKINDFLSRSCCVRSISFQHTFLYVIKIFKLFRLNSIIQKPILYSTHRETPPHPYSPDLYSTPLIHHLKRWGVGSCLLGCVQAFASESQEAMHAGICSFEIHSISSGN